MIAKCIQSTRIHFMILNHSGPGDAQVSSLFQVHLVGNDFWKDPLGLFIIVPP